MSSETGATAKKRPRKSGSEKRQKGRRLTIRLSPDERKELEQRASDAGLSLGSFIRARALSISQTRQRRRPSVELETIARLHAEMNRVGGNIHQILKRVNFGETPLAHEFHEALTGYREVIDAILTTLGRKRAA